MKSKLWRADATFQRTDFYLYTVTTDSSIEFDKTQPKIKSLIYFAHSLDDALREDEHYLLATGTLQSHLRLRNGQINTLNSIKTVEEIPAGLSETTHNGHRVWEQKKAEQGAAVNP